MGRIRILPDAIANKIAAGEVVERPASVVKELLENSLDAGACDLRVDVEAGGRRLIRIADDGSGMLRDDALLAFERHATSKLRTAEDLFSIVTLGFRGEALPSIASVSRLDLETRAREESTGTHIEIAGAKMVRCEEMAREPGTTITVRDLFYNVPARRKFLRSEQTELAHIASLVTHYSLAHIAKSFELVHAGQRLLLVTPVGSRRERVFQVFGDAVLADLVELPDTAHEGFRLTGFVSQPQVQKLNRNSIYLFINGRLIRDKLLHHALTAAYHNLMPPQCFPFALLFVDCPAEEVDVNVHPSKTEVRFQRGSFVHDFVRDAIRRVLVESRPAASLPLAAPPQPAALATPSEFSLLIDTPPAATPHQPRLIIPGAHDLEWPVVSGILPPSPPGGNAPVALSSPARPGTAPPGASSLSGPAPTSLPGLGPTPATARSAIRLPVPDTHGPLPAGAWLDAAVSLDVLADLRVIGQLHDSFIVAAGRDGLWIIDQHVAHERILFEQVLRQSTAGQAHRQPLLIPLVLPLTMGQFIEYPRIAEDLRAIGFDTEPFGARTIAIQSAPAGLAPGEIERSVQEILDVAENELRSATVEELRRGMAASVACRAAIKINTPLDQTKMEWLLQELARTEFPMSCPHGRPIALRYPMRDILKGFHRI